MAAPRRITFNKPEIERPSGLFVIGHLSFFIAERSRRRNTDRDPPTSEAASRICNPTDGSPWIFQILSTPSAANQSAIPRTVVRGFFRSFLLQALANQSAIPRTVVRGFFRSFLLHALQPVGNPTDGSPWIFSDPFYCTRCNRLVIPRTVVRGLFQILSTARAAPGW